MKKNNDQACQHDPTGKSCDIVDYAGRLDAQAVAADVEKMTTGKQKGFTKASVEGVLEAFPDDSTK